jgi:hypothetical protein
MLTFPIKAFLFSSALLAVAMADTCTDCTAVVSTIQARLMSEESLAAQGAIMVGGICPGAEDVAACEAGLPGLWNQIAALLWPGYWDPTADWMCADSCANPEDVTMTCDDCKMGIQAAIDQLLEPDTIDAAVEFIAPEICKDNPTEECPVAVDAIIRNGLPLLAAASDAQGFAQACNAAVEGTCPARKLRLF